MLGYKVAFVPLGVAGRNLANFGVFYYLSKEMGVEDFGVTSLGLSIINSIGGVVTLSLASGFGRYYYEMNERLKETLVIFAIVVGFVLSLLVYSAFQCFDGLKLKEFALLIVAAAYVNALSDFWLLSSRLKKEYLLFGIYNIIIVFILACVVFLADKLSPRSVFVAYLIQALPFACLLVVNSFKNWGGGAELR